MKDLIKNAKHQLLITLVLASIVTLYLYQDPPLFIKSFTHGPEILKAILPNLTASAIVGIIVTIFSGPIIKREKKNENDELLSGIQNIVHGLKYEKVDVAFEKAAAYIEDCERIHVIGTANERQRDTVSKGVKRYLDATEDRIKQNKSFKLLYQRITSLTLEGTLEPFREHLERIFQSKGNNNEVQLMFLANLSPAYTYLIIDRNFLLVTLTYKNEPSFCLYTELSKEENNTNEIIEAFIAHFEQVWENEEKTEKNVIINNIIDFNYIYKDQSKAAKSLKRVKDQINSLPKKSRLLQSHALKRLEEFSNKFEYGENSLKVDHIAVNQNMIEIFIDFLKSMNINDSYRTITFNSFWSNLFSTGTLLDRFIEANKKALRETATIERMLIIDNEKISNPQENHIYTQNIKRIIDENVKIMDEYKLYSFRLLFTSTKDHDDYERENYNFALITSKEHQETIICEPSLRGEGKYTQILFKKSEDSDTFPTHQSKLRILKDIWEHQTLSTKDKEFINSLNLANAIKDRLVGRKKYI